MNASTKNVISVVACLAMITAGFAFMGLTMNVKASTPGVSTLAEPRNVWVTSVVDAADGTTLVSLGDEAYGRAVVYQANDLTDLGITPDELSDYLPGSGATSGFWGATPPDYMLTDIGSRMLTIDPTYMTPIYIVFEINPTANAEHRNSFGDKDHNYTGGSYGADWVNEWATLPSATLCLLPKPVVTPSGANLVITWTEMPVDTYVANYQVYKSTTTKNGLGAYSVVSTVANGGVASYTDVGAFGGAVEYYRIGVQYNGGLYTPNTLSQASWDSPSHTPVTQVTAGAAYLNDNTPDIAYTGSDSGSDWVTTQLWGSVDGGAYANRATDNTVSPFSAVGPLVDGDWDFYSVGIDATTTEAAPGTPDYSTIIDTRVPTGAITGGTASPSGVAGPWSLTYTSTDDTTATANVAGVNSVQLYVWTPVSGAWVAGGSEAPDGTFAYTPAAGLGSYAFYLRETDRAGNVQPAPTVIGDADYTIVYADLGPISIVDTTAGTVEPGTAFQVTCTATDAQTLTATMVQLYYENELGVIVGPVVASTFTSVGAQITKADTNEEPMDTRSYGWNIAAWVNPGEFHYYFATDDGAGNTAEDPVGADLTVGPYYIVYVQVAGNQNQPHPLIGYVLDPLGAGLDGATVQAQWYDSTEGAWFTMTTITGLDGLGNSGWYQIDIYHNNWTIGDLLYVNATFTIAGVPYFGYNTTLFASGDNILPDDDKEYVNVTIVIQEFFELKWTLGWNIWSHPMIRSENVSLGLSDLPFSWFGNEHYLDTWQDGTADNCTLVAYVGGVYVTYVHPLDAGGPADLIVVPDNGYWAYVAESWFTDEAALAIAEVGILVPGQYIWRWAATRNVAVNAGWNLLGWTSFNTTFAATDVIWTLTSAAVSGDGVPQPEIIANWTADAWETAPPADMTHYEGLKGYTVFVSLGAAYGQSTAAHDFPVGPGYGFWVYSEVGGQTLTYVTA